MKETLITILRDKTASMHTFRHAARKLSFALASETSKHLAKETVSIETPLAKAQGKTIKNDVVLVPILRSGIALLETFLRFFERAKVGFVGLQRDEKTAIANMYYCKLPEITPHDDVIILDPMIATGGSGIDTIKKLIEEGIKEEKIFFAAIIAAPEGIKRIKDAYPNITITVMQTDEALNDKKFIVPGLGDFGDRYFGTEEPL